MVSWQVDLGVVSDNLIKKNNSNYLNDYLC